MITYFKDKNDKSEKRCKNYNTLNIVIKSVDSINIIGAKSTPIILSITVMGLIVLPVSAGIACTLSLGNKVLHKLIINKHKNTKNKLKKIKKPLNLLTSYTENLYKII